MGMQSTVNTCKNDDNSYCLSNCQLQYQDPTHGDHRLKALLSKNVYN